MNAKFPLLIAAALAVGACQPGPDPKAVAAAQAAADEKAASDMAKSFDEAVALGKWDVARAHGDILNAKYPKSQAAARIHEQYEKAKVEAVNTLEARRLAALWTYQSQPAKGGEQRSAALYAKEYLDTDGGGPHEVRLIFRDHPEWGRTSYLVLQAGDFDCYGGCKVKLKVDDAAPKPVAASRPKTDEAIAMFIEDERMLWRTVRGARTIAIEFPVKAGGTRTAVFEVGGLDADKLPGWK
ncbi:hypothetical protein [Lysobacter silvisoli]|uniref:Lipoprotein n=1 Tax=Lysobacter silvisoli TaxID=2293254 RepID=A0A371K0A9_9GAMM|nr:hypothetical protein [Lysobacter silvisoli]RDZ27353.1 hypothetical protein DX914_14050 [Lysobacter silvisoli]